MVGVGYLDNNGRKIGPGKKGPPKPAKMEACLESLLYTERQSTIMIVLITET